jgi:hypothetical protein
MERLGGPADNDQVRFDGLGNLQELLGRIAAGMDEQEVQPVFGRVPVDFALQLECLVGGAPRAPRVIKGAADGPGQPAADIDRGADEHGNGASAQAPGLAAPPPERIPGGVGAVETDHHRRLAGSGQLSATTGTRRAVYGFFAVAGELLEADVYVRLVRHSSGFASVLGRAC